MKKMKRIPVFLLAMMMAAAFCGCGCAKKDSSDKPVSGQPEVTQTPQDGTQAPTQDAQPTDTPEPTQDAQPTDAPTQKPTDTPTPTPEPTDAPTPTPEPTDTPTPTPEPTDTPTPTPEPTDTPTQTPTKELTPEEQLIGTWKTTYDFSKDVAGELEIDPPSTPLEAQVFIDLNADGSFRCRIDEESFHKNLDKWMDAVMPDILQMVYDEFAKKGIPAELVESVIKATMGCSMEEFAKQTVREEIDKEMQEELQKERKYRAEGDKLYLQDRDKEFSDTEYVLYSVNDDTLVIDATGSGGIALLPATKLTFKRVK